MTNNRILTIKNKLLELQAKDIASTNLSNGVTSYVILATGNSTIHISSITNTLGVFLRNKYNMTIKVEGTYSYQWVIMDIGDIIVNIVQSDIRKKYAFQQLWGI